METKEKVIRAIINMDEVYNRLSKLNKHQQIYIAITLKNLAETEDDRRIADIIYDRVIWGK